MLLFVDAQSSSSFTTTSASSIQSLTTRSSPLHRRIGYLDGFGKSGIQELDGDDMSSLLSTVRPNAKAKHKLAAALTIGVFGTLLSRPLWGQRDGYWTTVIIAYLLYFIEAMSSSTRRYLSNMLTPSQVIQMVNDIRESRPVLSWNIESYHYRYEHAHHSGKGRRAQESRTKVVTHRASQNYVYNECVDKTDVEPLLAALEYDPASHNPFLKVSFGKLLLFRDMRCYQDYLDQFHNFLLREGNRDSHTDLTTTFTVPCYFRSKLLAVRTVIGVREHVRLASFWFCTLLGMTFPYRVWFAQHCDCIDALLVMEVR